MYKYNDDYKEATEIINGQEFTLIALEHDMLKHRRIALGLTQQQVADLAHIQWRQYQRLESGERSIYSASMRIGLSVCWVLKLDPFRFIPELSMRTTHEMPDSTK